jgi:hypothetical protein
MLTKFVQWLDRKEFLNYRLWEFSLSNSARLFPYYFLFRILFFHPVKATRGIFKYQKLVRKLNGDALLGTKKLDEISHSLKSGTIIFSRFFIAPGFCMKPYDEAKRISNCPIGHFNHRCLVLENLSMFLTEQQKWQQPCNECFLGTLAQLSVKLGANFYIMTSALDIARDLHLPAIKGNGAHSGIFLLCPYSTEAFSWGLATSGMDGSLITFCKGDCLNHEDFTKADIGIKEKQTFVEQTVFENLKTELENLAQSRDRKEEEHFHYNYKNNVYEINNRAQHYNR